MQFKIKFLPSLLSTALALSLFCGKSHAKQSGDTAAYLARSKKSEPTSINIPLTKFCFVQGAGLDTNYSGGWITKSEILRKPQSKSISVLSFDQYLELRARKDSLAKVEKTELVKQLTKAIKAHDFVWDVVEKQIEDSMKLHPYAGPFRFWLSKVDKPGYSRTTYVIDGGKLIIKEGPYDFIYLAKNYEKDVVHFKRRLTKAEKRLLTEIEQQIGSDSLEKVYFNMCIMDGVILSCSFESAKFMKNVTVSNYYHKSIGKVVEFLNRVCPKKYRIWYGKEKLEKWYEECDL